MAQKLFKIKVSMEFVAYVDESIKDNDETIIPQLLYEAVREYPEGTTNTVKITELKNLKQLPKEWNSSCYPYGFGVHRKSIEDILKKDRPK